MASMQKEASTSIVKSDRAGRSRYTAQYKSEVVAAFEASGLSGPAFARQCGIKYPLCQNPVFLPSFSLPQDRLSEE